MQCMLSYMTVFMICFEYMHSTCRVAPILVIPNKEGSFPHLTYTLHMYNIILIMLKHYLVHACACYHMHVPAAVYNLNSHTLHAHTPPCCITDPELLQGEVFSSIFPETYGHYNCSMSKTKS